MTKRVLQRSNRLLLSLSFFVLGLIPVLSSVLAPSVYSASSLQPTINSTYVGANSTDNSPPSATIAASPSTKMELLNTGYMLINKTGTTTTGSIPSLIKTNGTFTSDPQVIWDPLTKRFYFSMFENIGTSSPNEGIVWGFSKNASPANYKSFCTYFNNFNYGATSFPDRQSLGDTSNFLLIGSNRYSTANEDLMGSDLAWISKPAAGNSCPSASSFSTGIQSLKNPDGTSPYIPTPARQVDSNGDGWVVATPSYVSGNTLTTFEVTKDPTSNTLDISQPNSLSVPAYSAPPSAPQAGKTMSGVNAPPLETRIYLTQAIMSYDPRVGHDAIWTAHTIAGGAGTEVRWYEINPWSNNLDQYGNVSDPNLYVFNGTISPDRVVNGSKTGFGQSAVIDVNTSSANNYSAIQLVSVINGQPESPMVMLKQSIGPDVDFTCFNPNTMTCRWGDYSGAVPDPSASLKGSLGAIWISNQWNNPDIDDNTPVWQTTVANVTP